MEKKRWRDKERHKNTSKDILTTKKQGMRMKKRKRKDNKKLQICQKVEGG